MAASLSFTSPQQNPDKLASQFSLGLINKLTPSTLHYFVRGVHPVFKVPALLLPTLPTLRKHIHPSSQYEDADFISLPLCHPGNGNMATTCPVHLWLDLPVALTKLNI